MIERKNNNNKTELDSYDNINFYSVNIKDKNKKTELDYYNNINLNS